jgi:hypothetical protein
VSGPSGSEHIHLLHELQATTDHCRETWLLLLPLLTDQRLADSLDGRAQRAAYTLRRALLLETITASGRVWDSTRHNGHKRPASLQELRRCVVEPSASDWSSRWIARHDAARGTWSSNFKPWRDKVAAHRDLDWLAATEATPIAWKDLQALIREADDLVEMAGLHAFAHQRAINRWAIAETDAQRFWVSFQD